MKNKNNVPSTIICNNDVELTKNEYYILYNFFVTHSLCNNQSKRKRTLKEYGIKRITDIEKQLSKYIKIDKGTFDILETDSLHFEDLINYNLNDKNLFDLAEERGVFTKVQESNKYFQVFYYIRNSLAHGEYTLKKDANDEKYIIMQNSKNKSIRARMVVKVGTLINIIRIIDVNNIILGDNN
ncbi:MAG: hypothetical protein IKM55_04625 [Bacilli bacterium]|nr:hypothetical protein [Bacilli bacterium]